MKKEEIKEFFSVIKDPRVSNRCDHLLIDVLFIAFCTLLSGGNDYEDMVEFGDQRLNWLKTVLDLPNGIPSHDTFNRVFQIIDSEQLEKCLKKDGGVLLECLEGKLINMDGKKLRGASPKSRGNKGIYIVSAWVGEHRLSLGQARVKDKSNEITAIPKVLEKIEIKGATVSIDAMGCQTEIAEKIVEKEAKYFLSVKLNQGDLHQEIKEMFEYSKIDCQSDTWEYDHGRYEERRCKILSARYVLSPILLERWKDIKTVIKIESKRTVNDVTSEETRYYISNDEQSSIYFNHLARGHWGIENRLHWHLDVTFNEDKSRVRTGNAPENLNIMRKLALQKIGRMNDKLSLKKRRYRAGLNNDYLVDILLTKL